MARLPFLPVVNSILAKQLPIDQAGCLSAPSTVLIATSLERQVLQALEQDRERWWSAVAAAVAEIKQREGLEGHFVKSELALHCSRPPREQPKDLRSVLDLDLQVWSAEAPLACQAERSDYSPQEQEQEQEQLPRPAEQRLH